MCYHNMSGTVVHVLEWPTLVLCSNPGHQTKGHHVPLGLCDHGGSSPALGGVLLLVFGSSFWGCRSFNLKPPTMGIAVALPFIAAAIPLRRWPMMTRSKAHDPLRRSTWSAADRAANYVVDRPPRWRLRIFVEIRRRQRDGSESYRID